MRLLQVFVTGVLVPLRAHCDIFANGVDQSEFKFISDWQNCVCRSAATCGPSIEAKSDEKQEPSADPDWKRKGEGGSSLFIRRNPVTFLMTRLPSNLLNPDKHSITDCLQVAALRQRFISSPAETLPLLCDCMSAHLG